MPEKVEYSQIRFYLDPSYNREWLCLRNYDRNNFELKNNSFYLKKNIHPLILLNPISDNPFNDLLPINIFISNAPYDMYPYSAKFSFDVELKALQKSMYGLFPT